MGALQGDQAIPEAASETPKSHGGISEAQHCPSQRSPSSNNFPAALKGRRILLATESLGPVNGVSRTTLSLIEYLRQNGVHMAVVAPKFDERRLKANRAAYADVRLHGQPLPYNPDLTVAYPFRFDRVCSRTFKPDLVYLASPASVGFQFLLQIRQLQEPPAVVCNFQTDLSAYSEIIFPPLMDRFAVWLLGVVQSFLFNHPTVQTVFYPSAGIRDYLVKRGTSDTKLVHLGRGVDTKIFTPIHRDDAYRKEIAPNGEIILACVCRLAPEKGFHFLAQVAEMLVKESLPFKLLIVGGNHNLAMEDEVHNLFDQVKDRVIFTGFLTGNSLARAYASSDIFLHCSITETFGLVVLEGMASGLPVIARDQGGPSEIVREGKTGYLVAPQDRDTFVSRILYLSRSASVRSRMAAAALQQADDSTWEKINQRVAWHLAADLEKYSRNIRAGKSKRPIRNWLARRYAEFQVGFFLPLLQLMQVNAAIGIVYFFWMIAVVPLMVHGNSVYPASWHIVHGLHGLLQEFQARFLRR